MLEQMLMQILGESSNRLGNARNAIGSGPGGATWNDRVAAFGAANGPLLQTLLALQGQRRSGLAELGFLGGFSQGVGGGGLPY